jgi:hypothetical protein
MLGTSSRNSDKERKETMPPTGERKEVMLLRKEVQEATPLKEMLLKEERKDVIPHEKDRKEAFILVDERKEIFSLKEDRK